MAFVDEAARALHRLRADAVEHGWAELPLASAHPIAGGAQVVYLEDRDGFEVELVVPKPH